MNQLIPSPKVSIIIPTYQQVTYLRKLLDSVQSQLFTDYEVIIHDDSPSNIVQELVKNYPLNGKLQYFHNQPALGNPENWNAAIRRARGEYIKVMMHDDWFIDETSLGKFVQIMEDKPEVNFGFAAETFWDMRDNQKITNYLTAKEQKKMARAPEWLFFRNRVGMPSSTIFRRQLNQFYDSKLKYIVDLDFNLRAIMAQNDFAYHPAPLVCVTAGLDFQVTQSVHNNKSVELIEHAHVFNKIYDKKFDPRFFLYWIKFFLKFKVDKNDQEYHRICRTYPKLSSYMALVLQGKFFIQQAARIKFLRVNFLYWLLPQK
ncbi:MAG: glycosyltransferase family 2 protein [Saprospiraceae bacterium]